MPCVYIIPVAINFGWIIIILGFCWIQAGIVVKAIDNLLKNDFIFFIKMIFLRLNNNFRCKDTKVFLFIKKIRNIRTT